MVLNYSNVTYDVATEDDLIPILSGEVDTKRAFQDWMDFRFPARSTGVLRVERGTGLAAKPAVLISREEDQRRLFARLSQVRSDFSPITAWAHLVTPEFAERFDDLSIPSTLGRMTSAWCGLIVAEAILASGRPIGRLNQAACFGTQSYVVARSAALWGITRSQDVLERYDRARSCLGQRGERPHRLREQLMPIWNILLSVTMHFPVSNDRATEAVARILERLLDSDGNDGEWPQFMTSTLLEPATYRLDLQHIHDLPSKARLDIYDHFLGQLRGMDRSRDSADFLVTTLACGYLSTIVAGGEASLKLAEATVGEFPEIFAWAYVLGSLGEKVTWTSGLGGLGRFIARELERPLHLLEPPQCDISVEEAATLVDPALSDPLVHLNLKSSRTAEVSLYPGVIQTISFDSAPEPRPSVAAANANANHEEQGRPKAEEALLKVLADALLPLIQDRLSAQIQPKSGTKNPSSSRMKNRGKEASLPFPEGRKR